MDVFQQIHVENNYYLHVYLVKMMMMMSAM
jgi:hypothetical protein